MNRSYALVCLVVGSMAALACGGNVVVDSPSTGGSTTSTTSTTTTSGGGTLGEGGGPTAACPSMPTDSDLMSLTGQPCETPGAMCVAFDESDCSDCMVTCGAGAWSAPDCVTTQGC